MIPREPYVERFWLGVLGPSTTWLLRRLVGGFDDQPEGFDLSLGETARPLGLGDRGGRHSPFLRTVNRMVQFELAQVRPGAACWPCGASCPRSTGARLQRHSPAMQDAHDRWQAEQLKEPPGEQLRRRCRLLALSLLELGEDVEAAERQLLRWRYHPALAREAAVWAWDRTGRRRDRTRSEARSLRAS